MSGTEYHKIAGPFHRFVDGPYKNRFNPQVWYREEFKILANANWTWTEKVNGTNVRIIWDGHKVGIGGRTDEAAMALVLYQHLRDEFPEELLEQQFGSSSAVLYGEGYGARVQKGGGSYSQTPKFVLFDVKVANPETGKDWWLLPHSVDNVAKEMGISVVPTVLTGTVYEAINVVSDGLKSQWGDFQAEGLVGRPPAGLMGRDGDRLLMKIKSKDFT